VKTGEYPSVVDKRLVKEFQKAENKNGIIELPKRYRYSLNQSVHIQSGPFAEQIGLYQHMTPEKKIAVLLKIIGRNVTVLFNESQVSAA
jgi:transcription antitermination factor NusG